MESKLRDRDLHTGNSLESVLRIYTCEEREASKTEKRRSLVETIAIASASPWGDRKLGRSLESHAGE